MQENRIYNDLPVLRIEFQNLDQYFSESNATHLVRFKDEPNHFQYAYYDKNAGWWVSCLGGHGWEDYAVAEKVELKQLTIKEMRSIASQERRDIENRYELKRHHHVVWTYEYCLCDEDGLVDNIREYGFPTRKNINDLMEYGEKKGLRYYGVIVESVCYLHDSLQAYFDDPNGEPPSDLLGNLTVAHSNPVEAHYSSLEAVAIAQ